MEAKRILLTVSYDGTAYCGWQFQENGPSVQAALEGALQEALGAFAADCQAQGLPVLLGSGYRSYYIQSQTYEAKAA